VHRKRRSTIHAAEHTRDGRTSWLWANLTLTPFYVWGIRLRQTLKDYSSFYKKTRRRVTRNSGAVVARGLSLYD